MNELKFFDFPDNAFDSGSLLKVLKIQSNHQKQFQLKKTVESERIKMLTKEIQYEEGVCMKYPVKLEKNPINEVSLEVRFQSIYPPEAVFGVIYSHIKEQFSAKPTPHPIMQLPEKIRLNDPALRYNPYYKIENDNMELNIGPEVVSFVNRQRYLGWEAFSTIFYKTFGNLIDSQVFDVIHSMNLRYINVFEENIFNHINLKIIFDSDDIHNQPIDFKTVLYREKFENFIRLGNSFDIEIEDKIVKRSIYDISCKSKIENTESFLKNPSDLIEKAHRIEKQIFFQTLKKDYIKTFEPDYGGE